MQQLQFLSSGNPFNVMLTFISAPGQCLQSCCDVASVEEVPIARPELQACGYLVSKLAVTNNLATASWLHVVDAIELVANVEALVVVAVPRCSRCQWLCCCCCRMLILAAIVTAFTKYCMSLPLRPLRAFGE